MKTTPTYGLRYPELRVDPPDLSTQLSNLDTDVNAALNALFPDSGVVTGDGVTTGLIVTPAAGWSVRQTQYRTIGVKMWLLLEFTRTGAAIDASSIGNIPDEQVATITDPAHRPALDWYGNFRSVLTSGSATIDSAGAVFLRDAHSGSSIATGDGVNIYAPYSIQTGAGLDASTVRGLYFPALTDRPIGPDDVTQIALTAESIDAALTALIPDTGTRTDAPITPGDGWSLLIGEYRLIGKDMTLHVWLQREGSAITASDKGNIVGDPALFTIDASNLRPSLDLVVGQARASITGGAWQLSSAGVCQLYDLHSSSVIAAPTKDGKKQTLQVYTSYPIP